MLGKLVTTQLAASPEGLDSMELRDLFMEAIIRELVHSFYLTALLIHVKNLLPGLVRICR
jgi:hypothetical protein